LDPRDFVLTNGFEYDQGVPPLCSETSPEIFFPDEKEDENGKLISSTYTHEAEAKSVCAKCEYRVPCLIAALKTSDIGIWGGTTESERRKIKREKIDPARYQIRTRKGSTKASKLRFL
jgi:WhiB family redox-sensing transcriptional regulator